MRRSGGRSETSLEDDLRSWWKGVQSDWDRKVDAPRGKRQDGKELWDDMPVIDSKVVAETLPIFEHHLGIPLDVTLIKPGGYSSIEELISDLVPKMRDARRTEAQEKRKKGAVVHEKGT